jgi:hypothetical protein
MKRFNIAQPPPGLATSKDLFKHSHCLYNNLTASTETLTASPTVDRSYAFANAHMDFLLEIISKLGQVICVAVYLMLG